MPNLLILIAFLLSFATSSSVFSSEPIQSKIKIGYGVADGFIDEDDTGVGMALLKAVGEELSEIGYEVEYKKAPFNRIISQYASAHLDVAFPIISGDYMGLEYFKKWKIPFIPLYSMPIYNGGAFAVFSPTTKAAYNSIAELKDSRIGVLAGVYMPTELKAPTSYNVTEIHGIERAVKLLKVGRLDALVLHRNWAQTVMAPSDFEQFHVGESFSHIYGSFVTQPTSNGAVILAEINKIIARMIIDGRYKAMLAAHKNTKSIIHYGQ